MTTSQILYRKPALLSTFTDLQVAESTRHGGVSPSPFASLNLGLNTTDGPENVTENRRRFFAGLGIDSASVASSHQVHGDQILTVRQPGRYEGYDALITNQSGIFLTVTVADCTPILIYDPVRRAAAAIHAGWRGTVAGLAGKTLQAMVQQFGTRPADCYAYVGTCIDQCSFEVGTEVAEQFAETHKTFDSQRQKYCIDLKVANADQLTAAGLPVSQLECSPYSTVTHNQDYFSYRHEQGYTGRMLALIGLQPEKIK